MEDTLHFIHLISAVKQSYEEENIFLPNLIHCLFGCILGFWFHTASLVIFKSGFNYNLDFFKSKNNEIKLNAYLVKCLTLNGIPPSSGYFYHADICLQVVHKWFYIINSQVSISICLLSVCLSSPGNPAFWWTVDFCSKRVLLILAN